jgi:hypothetical protein
MEFPNGCLICGNELLYAACTTTEACWYCGALRETNTSCVNGHFVCDCCHNGTANDLIERYCCHTGSTYPLSLALKLMNNPLLKMHGPEHHFLVPAVLLAAYQNLTAAGETVVKENIRQARKRAEEVKGGFCGYCGACGAAIGTGIFVSIITGATPVSDAERKQSNMMTSESLRVIAENGGPRCCKRDSFWAIITAKEFVQREFGVVFPVELPPSCPFGALNRECLGKRCAFFGQQGRPHARITGENAGS